MSESTIQGEEFVNQLDSHVWLGINYFNCKSSEEIEIIPLECFVSAINSKKFW